nr:uncharacterized protein LOC106621913 [Bactrocera oleae]
MIRNFRNVFCAYRHAMLCQREKAVQGIRRSHVVSYREVPLKQSAITKVGAEIVGAAMWWWILWHLWHESEHITNFRTIARKDVKICIVIRLFLQKVLTEDPFFLQNHDSILQLHSMNVK